MDSADLRRLCSTILAHWADPAHVFAPVLSLSKNVCWSKEEWKIYQENSLWQKHKDNSTSSETDYHDLPLSVDHSYTADNTQHAVDITQQEENSPVCCVVNEEVCVTEGEDFLIDFGLDKDRVITNLSSVITDIYCKCKFVYYMY